MTLRSGVIWLVVSVIWCFLVSREDLSDSKKQNRCLVERVESLQTQLSDCEIHCSELDGRVKHAHNVSDIYLCVIFYAVCLDVSGQH